MAEYTEQDREDLIKFLDIVKEDEKAAKDLFIQIYESGRKELLSRLWIEFLEDRKCRKTVQAWQLDKEICKIVRDIYCT